jgi:hypothetical protein
MFHVKPKGIEPRERAADDRPARQSAGPTDDQEVVMGKTCKGKKGKRPPKPKR